MFADANREEDTLDEVEMSGAEYEQKQRLMALAKAHTAQLMNKMDSLAPEERQAFLQSQVQTLKLYRHAFVSNTTARSSANHRPP